MKIFITIILAAYSIFFILLYVGVLHFEVAEDHFLVIAGTLLLLFCFSLLGLIFIARSVFLGNQEDHEPIKAEEEVFEIEEDQPEQFTDNQITEPNVDI